MQFVCIKVNQDQLTIDKLNWHLAQGWGVCDRFEMDNYCVVMLKK